MIKVKKFYTVFVLVLVLVLCGCTSQKKQDEKEAKNVKDLLDSIVEVEEGRDITVLQLTDTEIIDSTQKRTKNRLVGIQYTLWLPQHMEKLCFKYIRDAIERAHPDFIIITGDLIYGEFDDSGTSLEALVDFMDSFKIPWAPVLGDLDYESAKGANWQCEVLESSEYCCFKRGDTDGNGNYSVGIMQGDELVRIFYMMDSNTGHRAYEPEENHVTTTMGFTENQMKWLYDRMSQTEELLGENVVNASLCCHLPPVDAVLANEKYTSKRFPFVIDENVRGEEGDLGGQNQEITGFQVPTVNGMTFVDLLKKYHVDSVFMGHYHKVNTSVLHEGIRWTFGLKTGEYETYKKELLGGTQLKFNKESLDVKHIYFDRSYEEYLENMDYFD